MTPEFIRLLALEKMRSFSFGRDLLSAILLFVLIGFILFYLLGISVFLGLILRNVFEIQHIPSFLNMAAIYYLLAEFLTRFFIQKKPLLDLYRYLHLPIKRSGIIHFLLVRSLFTPFSLLVLLLFLPVTITDISPVYGPLYATLWLGTLFFFSIAMHFLVLWFKEVNSGRIGGTISVFILAILPFVLLYFNSINIGTVSAPFFALSHTGPVALIIGLASCITGYLIIFRRYLGSAYLEEGPKQAFSLFGGSGTNLFSRFGIAGTLADMELKLILRHKKSRGYLIMSLLFLSYGLLFYGQSSSDGTSEISGLYLFVGVFITSIFFVQYGQFFLSWTSASFDFFITKKYGLESLVRGKLLLLISFTIITYLLSLPYIYFGWHIFVLHTAALFYNIGIGIHIIVFLSLWEPKPIDINKGALFNYDGIGIAQFLMAIPFFALPYFIYVPISMLADPYTGIVAVGLFGLTGLIFFEKFVAYTMRKLRNHRYKISSSFRRGT